MIDITPITPSIGAEIAGVSVTNAIDDAELTAAIRSALLDHHVLVFRDQHLNREEHKAFGRGFWPLHIHPSKRGAEAKGDQEIFTVKADSSTVRNNGGRWHMDVSCEEVPPLGSILASQGGAGQVGTEHAGVLGQPLCSTLCGLGLPSACASGGAGLDL